MTGNYGRARFHGASMFRLLREILDETVDLNRALIVGEIAAVDRGSTIGA